MKSGKQRRKELQAKREKKRAKTKKAGELKQAKRRAAELKEREAKHAEWVKQGIDVNYSELVPIHSYGWSPDFASRGYYSDWPFTCVDCGIEQVWTAHQQKWWYEVAKGTQYSGPVRCRTCRQRKRAGKTTPPATS